MPDRFDTQARGLIASAEASFTITPSDTVDLPETIRQITLAAGGTLRWMGRSTRPGPCRRGLIRLLPAGSWPQARRPPG